MTAHETSIPARPAPSLPARTRAVLDYVLNRRRGRPYLVRFTAPEFTLALPVTGQPDFAHLMIDLCAGRGRSSESSR